MTVTPPPLTLEIVSDVVCPWCFIGLRRLDRALAVIRQRYPEIVIGKRWRPFFLNPDTPPEGEPYLPFLIAKFGSREAVEDVFRRVREHGAAYGLDYRFDRIALRANTLHAHRLIHWVQSRGDDAQPLIERIFVGQFQRGEHVGAREVLADIAAECGYDRATVAAWLDGDEAVEQVRAEERESRAWGVRAVPTFVVDRKVVVPGAEDPAILVEAIEQVWRATA